jgi:molecular chaperone DnaK
VVRGLCFRVNDFILGIDLGTTNSLVGVVDSGFPILLADAEGRRILPSAVYFPSRGGEIVVGEAALRMRGIDSEADRVITSVKRLMGDPDTVIEHDGVSYGPEEVSAEILKHLKATAERAMETVITRAVVTVPAYFNDGQRNATKRAAELAGLKVERIVNEPTAAALAYGLDKLDEKSKVAVYDLGGGTFDISILELNAGVFQVMATKGDTMLGGDDIDQALADALWAQAGEDGETPRVFVEAAQRAKIDLSGVETTTVRLPFYAGAKSFEREVTRGWFEEIIGPVVRRTVSHSQLALHDSGLKASELDAIVLAGGSTRIPLVQRIVAEVFGQEPDVSQNPDESIAMGAVIQAGILSGAMKNMVLLDVTPLSLGIETFGGLMNAIIPRNTTIPVKRGELFTNAVANQKTMKIRVLQGEREMARDNWDLGSFELEFEPGQKGSARVGVQFEIDANGILQVLARDTVTNTDKVLKIESAAVNVEDEQVESMISESVEYAFEDMNERIWTEAKMKSEELLPAVDGALDVIGDQLDAAERDVVLSAASDVRAALESRDVGRLKAANKALDEATEHMAAVLVEKFM